MAKFGVLNMTGESDVHDETPSPIVGHLVASAGKFRLPTAYQWQRRGQLCRQRTCGRVICISRARPDV